jgi:hypothetical protein
VSPAGKVDVDNSQNSANKNLLLKRRILHFNSAKEIKWLEQLAEFCELLVSGLGQICISIGFQGGHCIGPLAYQLTNRETHSGFEGFTTHGLILVLMRKVAL